MKRKARLPWQRKRRRALVGVFFCFLLVLAYFGYRTSARQELNAALQEYQATGAPLTMAALLTEVYPPDPAAQALGVRLQEALSLLAPLDPERGRLLPYYHGIQFSADMPVEAALLDEMERVLAENQGTLDVLHELLDTGGPLFQGGTGSARELDPAIASGLGPRFLEQYRSMNDAQMLNRWASLSKLLRSAALAAAARQEGAAAVRENLALLRLAETLRKAPFQSVQHYRRNLLEEWIENLGQILSRCDLSEAQLAALDQPLSGINLLQGAERVLQGDFTRWMANVWPQLDQQRILARLTGALDRDRAGEVAGVMALQACYALPPREAEVAWRNIFTREFAMRARFGEATRPAHLHRINALLDTARVAIAMCRFRLRHGRPPERIEELIPGELARIPEDPLSGTALLCKQEGERWTIYSVSFDGKDDGGLLQPPEGRRSGGFDAGIMIVLRPGPQTTQAS